MQILFINTNPIVQKLIEVTAAKANVRLITVREPSEIGDIAKYDYIIADDGCYSIDKSKYKQLLKNRRACLIYSKEMYSGFSEYIKKPFIPTHILNIIIEEIAKSKKEHSFESIEEEVVPEDMSVDSVLQATRAMRTAEDSLSSLDLLSKELNIKHPEASPQDKVNDSFAKQAASEPPAKEISTEELLADTDLHKDEQAPESLDIDDINLDDLVDEAESTPQEEAKDNPPSATPAPEPATKEANEAEPATPTPEASETQPQVLDKEQISEVSELLDAIGDESNGEPKQEQTPQPATESAPSESAEDAMPDLAQAGESPSESDIAGESDLDLDALGLELADKPDESAQEAQELDLDSIDLTQPTSSDEAESAPQEEAPTQESQELEDVIQESPAQDEVPQESSIQDEVAQDEVDEVAQASEPTAQERQDSESDSKQVQEFFADISAELSEASQDELPAKDELEPAIEAAETPQDEAPQAPQEVEVALEDITESLPQEDNAQESGAETSVADELGEDIALDEVALADIEIPADEPSAPTDDVADIDIAQDSQSTAQSTEDFSNLNENEVAEALGEEPLAELQTPQDSTPSDDGAQPQPQSAQSAVSPAEIDAVKNAIGKSLEGALQSMASNELKTLLDGMEVSINISFKDAKK